MWGEMQDGSWTSHPQLGTTLRNSAVAQWDYGNRSFDCPRLHSGQVLEQALAQGIRLQGWPSEPPCCTACHHLGCW